MYPPTTSLSRECLPESIMVDKEKSSPLPPLRGVVRGIVAPDVTRTGGKVGGKWGESGRGRGENDML